jgi:hypothetical protein
LFFSPTSPANILSSPLNVYGSGDDVGSEKSRRIAFLLSLSLLLRLLSLLLRNLFSHLVCSVVKAQSIA